MIRIDLHAHTTASDGTLAPAELVRYAERSNVDILGVTDHDTVDGVAEAEEAGRESGVRVVAGVELSARYDGANVHVLGYFLDPSGPICSELGAMRAERFDRARRMVVRLGELGYPLMFEEVLEQAAGGVVGRPHVARALVARGYVPDVGSAFTSELIGDRGRAEVSRRLLTPNQAVELIRRSGGVAVLAHPAAGRGRGGPGRVDPSFVRALVDAGLRGIEVDHPDQPEDARAELRKLAIVLDLVTTGGSDCHGTFGVPLGACRTSEDEFRRLEEAARR